MVMISSIKPYNVVSFRAHQNPVIKEAIDVSQMLEDNGFEHTEESYYRFINSEIEELRQARKNRDFKNMEEELGDVLFDTVMLANHYGIDPVKALKSSSKKIRTRIEKAREIAQAPLTYYPFNQRLIFWDMAKKELKNKE